MFVEVIDVVREDKPSSNGKGTYGLLIITYRSNGKVAEKKLTSFANPSVFKYFEAAKKGDSVDVTSVKNDKTGYWDWIAIGTGEAQVAQQPSTNNSATRVTGSNYETKEERAVKQRYIVRQSSVANAIAALGISAKSTPKSGEIVELAKVFEAYVFSQPSALDMLVEEMGSDIPE
jgi:hypothetical protein